MCDDEFDYNFDDADRGAAPAAPPVIINVDRGRGVAHYFETALDLVGAMKSAQYNSKQYGVEIYLRGTSLYVLEPTGSSAAFKRFWANAAPFRELLEKYKTDDFFEQLAFEQSQSDEKYNPLWKP